MSNLCQIKVSICLYIHIKKRPLNTLCRKFRESLTGVLCTIQRNMVFYISLRVHQCFYIHRMISALRLLIVAVRWRNNVSFQFDSISFRFTFIYSTLCFFFLFRTTVVLFRRCSAIYNMKTQRTQRSLFFS